MIMIHDDKKKRKNGKISRIQFNMHNKKQQQFNDFITFIYLEP